MFWTRRDFIASHRPYVWAVSHAVLNDERKIVEDIHTLRKLCLNAPATILNQQYYYVAIGENGLERVVHREVGSGGPFVTYPADPTVS